MMNYGGAPMVPTYDYGPSDRSLQSRNSRGSSRRSMESSNSTHVDTVINHSRNKADKVFRSRESAKSAEFFKQQRYMEDTEDEARHRHLHQNETNNIKVQPTASSSSQESSPRNDPESPSVEEYQKYGGNTRTYQVNSPSSVNHLSTNTAAGTIAVFGATTKTGQAFVRLALDAGYVVKALLGNSKKMDEQTNLLWIVGSLNDDQAIRECVEHADFVVCTLTEHKFKKQKDMLRTFVQRLYPIMREQRSIQLFLFQASSLSANLEGRTPVLSKIIKFAKRKQSLLDQDFIIQFMKEQHQPEKNEDTHTPSFSFLITRPSTFIKDGPSIKKLAASKSQPGPFCITHIDLAEFSLNALVNPKLYNTCPYVVADSGI